VGMRLYNFLVGIFPGRDAVVQTPNLTHLTPEEYVEYSSWFLTINPILESKIQELEYLRNRYCTDIVMDPKTMDSLVPRFKSIWENI